MKALTAFRMVAECSDMHNSEKLRPDRVLQLLSKHGYLNAPEDASIEVLRVNSERSARWRRTIFRVWEAKACRMQVYAGCDLADFYERAEEFCGACETISCPPLFRFREEEHDFVGFAFAAGENAAEAYLAGRLPADELLRNLRTLEEALAGTAVASTTEAAATELEELLRAVRETNLLGETDLALLDTVISPRLRAGLIRANPETRWTNGDFLAQNIIVTDAGPKLVDYEFAHRTHFYAEDWARIVRHSEALPASVFDWARKRLGAAMEATEIYGLLRQIVLEQKIKAIPQLAREVTSISRQLAPLVGRWRQESAPSVFVPEAGSEQIAGNARAQFQVFYGRGGAFAEGQSITTPVAEGIWSRVELPLPLGRGKWDIRLDPTHCAGVVEISCIEIRRAGEAAGEPVALAEVVASGTCVAALTAPALTVIGYGPDPQILLPAISVEEPGPVWLTTWVRWESLATGLGRVLDEFVKEKVDIAALERAREQEKKSEDAHAVTKKTLTSALVQLEEERTVRSQTTLALEAERGVRHEIALELEGERAEFRNYRKLTEERQRTFDQGALQMTRKLRDLELACKEAAERASRLEKEELRMREQHAREMESERGLRMESEKALARCVSERKSEQEVYAEKWGRTSREGEERTRLAREEAARTLSAAQEELRALRVQKSEMEALLRHGLLAAQKRVETMESSISWRATAPVRRMVDLLLPNGKKEAGAGD
jgi:hypothetical protein